MRLFYLQPNGHGPTSYFVLADSADEAAEAINAERARWAAEGCGGQFWDGWGSDGAITALHLSEAVSGQVVSNDNA